MIFALKQNSACCKKDLPQLPVNMNFAIWKYWHDAPDIDMSRKN